MANDKRFIAKNGLDNNSKTITNVTNPTNAQDAATKSYVDSSLTWANIANKPDPTITLGGDLSGSLTLTDLASGTLTATIVANSVTLGTDTTGNYAGSVSAGGGIAVAGTAGEGTTFTVSHADTSAQTSVNNSNGVVIQDVTLDGYGHVTGLASVDLDTRYQLAGSYLTAESDTLATVTARGNTTTSAISIQNLTPSTSTSTGALKVDGGVGIVGDVYVGGNINAANGIYASVFYDANDPTYFVNSNGSSVQWYGTYKSGLEVNNGLSYVSINPGSIDNSDGFTYAGSLYATTGSFSGDVTVSGNLTVSGTTTIVNSETVSVADNILLLNSNITGTPTENGGIEIERGTLTNAQLLWNETTDRWTVAGATTGTLAYTSEIPSVGNGAMSVTAGSGLSGGGQVGTANQTGASSVTLSHADTSTATSLTALTGANVVSDIDVDGFGHVTSMATRTMTLADLGYTGATNATVYQGWDLYVDGSIKGSISNNANVNIVGGTNVTLNYSATNNTITINSTDTNTTYTAGSGLSLSGTTFSHLDTSAVGNLTASGRRYVTGLTFDGYGHVTGYTTGTETVVNTDTNTTSLPVKNSAGTLQFIATDTSGIRFAGSGATTVSFDDLTQTVTFSSTDTNTDTNYYVSGASFNDGNGILTLTRSGLGAIDINLDGRWLTTESDTLASVTARGATHSVNITPTANATYTLGTSTLQYSGVYSSFFYGHASSATTASSATNASFVYIERDDTTNANRYLTFVDSASPSNQRLNVDTDFYYNPSTNTLIATNFSGTATYAKYADVAERYETDGANAAGTIMVFGGEKEVTASTKFAQTKIAGVISDKPAYAMNSEAGSDETHPYIALQGRVPCKVVGKVRKGDIIVASEYEGVGQAWANEEVDPRMTAYVGIAIADKDTDGVGLVEVKVGK